MSSRKNKQQAKAKKKRERERQRHMKARRSGGGNPDSNARLDPNLPGRGPDDAIPFLAKPKSYPGESIEDRAVLEEAAEKELSAELRLQAQAVRDSLKLVSSGDNEAAVAPLRSIPRNSPYADWRMFIRGLISFYQDDLNAAQDNWRSLNPSRRPAIIATVLLQSAEREPAKREPAEQKSVDPKAAAESAKQNETADAANGIGRAAADEKESSRRRRKAELVRQFRDERAALKIPRQIAAFRHRGSIDTFSASQLSLLVNWRNSWKKLDPEFVRKFESACMQLVFMQPRFELFTVAIQRIPGPLHDPVWTLFSYNYYRQFEQADELADQAMRKYLDRDLPKVTALTAEARGAIASLILLKDAQEQRSEPSWFPFSMSDKIDVGKLFKRAIAAYPKHREAHQEYIGWLENELQRVRDKRQQTKLEKEIVDAQIAWHKALPDDVPPRLWLIDHYLDEDNLQQAQKIVSTLDGVRLEDPNLKALPWKLKLREAMSLSRQKKRLNATRECLAEAEKLWPAWLPKNWLGFLHAAVEFRAGNEVGFAEMKQAAFEVVGNDPLLCDVMLFAALQVMNVPAATLKPFRAALDRQVAGLNSLELADLTRLGSFFWDLQRGGLYYPALRMHAPKFGKRFFALLKTLRPEVSVPGINETCLWASKSKFWITNDDGILPPWLQINSKINRYVAMAILRMVAGQTYAFTSLERYRHLIPLLEEWAKNEPDAYYRHLLTATVESIHQKQSELNDRYGPGLFGFMGGMSGGFDDDYDDDEDDEDDEDNDAYEDSRSNQCNCPRCRAKRAREKRHRSFFEPEPAGVGAGLPFDINSDLFENGELPEGLPPELKRVFEKLGKQGAQELCELRDVSPEDLIELFQDYNISPTEALRFIETMAEMANEIDDIDEPPRRKRFSRKR